ncbi:MAG: hypothetical protein OXT74_14105 [Candidatus Poribacteria bacterium]|nr:hypothetical protein [Candidatus Poribacteria bacterium]
MNINANAACAESRREIPLLRVSIIKSATPPPNMTMWTMTSHVSSGQKLAYEEMGRVGIRLIAPDVYGYKWELPMAMCSCLL